TDENGEVSFTGLDHGKYQITEIKTHPGNALLKEPIIVTVPMTMTEEEANSYGNVDFDAAKEDVSYTDKWFFYSCLYEVTNNATFKMAMTGGDGTWKIGFVGMGVLALVGTGLIVHETKTNKRKR
ncbi:surface protein, partial [gut metagenome]